MENQKKEVWLRKALFLIVSLALFFPMMAQTITVKGVVKESMTGEPIIGANVAVKGTTNGTISDISGMYQISNVSSNAVLIVSYIGYKTAEIPVNGKNTINVSLEEESIGLQEVVAVGYGSQKKKELTGSVAGLKEGDLIKGVQSDPMGMLQGKVAGLNISKPNAGDPNGEYKFQLRGTSSLTGNTSPLIVIDGIPQGDLSAIPQDDIESIDVLKDGSAAAIYGTRGTNGVILVTTKRGSAGKMSVTYNGYMSISSIANQLEVMDRDQFLANGGNDRGYDTNWMDEITRTPFSHSHNLALTGGTTDFNYRASVSYRNNQGIALKSGFNEMIARFSANQNLFDKKIQIAYDATYRRFDREGENSSYDDYSAFKHAYYYNPTAPVYDETGTIDAGGYYALDIQGYSNPGAYIMQRDRRTKGGLFQGSARVTWNILEGLRAQAFGSLKYSDINKGTYTSREVFNTSSFGSASRSFNTRFNKTLETTIDYVKSFGEHHLAVLGGYTYEHNYRESFGMNNSNFDSDVYSYYNLGAGSNLINNPSQSMMDGSVSQDNLVSFFGRVNYNWGNRYLLSASVRREGSTRLGADYKWGTFPAVSVGWSIGNEAFMESASWINDLKLRLGYGVTGNMPSDNYLSLSMMGVVGRFYDHTSKQWINAYGPTQNQNPDLKWEKNESLNIGFDFGLLGGRLNGTIDWYSRTTRDLISSYNAQQPSLIYNTITTNVGTMRNRGIELALNAEVVKTKDFSYTANFTFSYENNKLTSLSNDVYKSSYEDQYDLPSPGNPGKAYRLQEGQPIASFFGYVCDGINPDGTWNLRDIDGKEGLSDADRTFIGNGLPKFKAGLQNTFTYKNFDFSFFLRGMFDYDVLNEGAIYFGTTVNIDQSGTNVYKDALKNKVTEQPLFSSYYLEKGNFLKIDNVTLGYTFNFKNNKYVRNLRIYGNVTNLATITGYSGLTPDVNVTGLQAGIEKRGSYPTTRTFTFGVNFGF